MWSLLASFVPALLTMAICLIQVDGTRLQREQPFEIKGGSVIKLGALEGPCK